ALLALFQVLLAGLDVAGNELNGLALVVRVVDDRDNLAVLIGGDVTDTRAVVQMPSMNADRAADAAPADLHHQRCGQRLIFFIFFVIRFVNQFVAGEPLWPVALLAGLARRAQVLYG